MSKKHGDSSQFVTVGKLTAVYGVKGWIKVHSYMEPPENILNFTQWLLRKDKRSQRVEIDAIRTQGKGFIVHLVGVDDREIAREYTQWDIQLNASELPDLDSSEYYWHQLEGLQVFHLDDGKPDEEKTYIGRVDYLLETGANDVLVVKLDKQIESTKSTEKRKEVLIPYLPDQVVKRIALDTQSVYVDWPYWDDVDDTDAADTHRDA